MSLPMTQVLPRCVFLNPVMAIRTSASPTAGPVLILLASNVCFVAEEIFLFGCQHFVSARATSFGPYSAFRSTPMSRILYRRIIAISIKNNDRL